MSNTHDPLKKQLRKTRKRHRLGPDATCFACGRTNLHTLNKVKRSHASRARGIACPRC